MSYEEILKVFNDRRGEYNFPPSTIDNLPDNQRKEVEKLIIRNCLRGDTNCFNYLKIIKFYDVSKLFTVEELDKMQPEKKGILAEILYEKTHNNIYLNYSLKNSSDNTVTKEKREHFAPKTVFNIKFKSDNPEDQKKKWKN